MAALLGCRKCYGVALTYISLTPMLQGSVCCRECCEAALTYCRECYRLALPYEAIHQCCELAFAVGSVTK